MPVAQAHGTVVGDGRLARDARAVDSVSFDVHAGRTLAMLEALLGQIQAFARELKVPTPTIDVIVPSTP